MCVGVFYEEKNILQYVPAAAAAVVYGYASNPAYCPGYGAAAAAATAFCFNFDEIKDFFINFHVNGGGRGSERPSNNLHTTVTLHTCICV